jgi:thiamine kinase-like enzyme
MEEAGALLRVAHEKGDDGGRLDIRQQVRSLFERYRAKRKEFFDDGELKPEQVDFEVFGEVPDQPSHNDLNAANILYNGGIVLIDPSEEGYNDVARDVGRYCASCFFNNYDYFGNDVDHSLELARVFLANFDEQTLRRARFYIGESFLSFLKFDTMTVGKEVLKRLAINLLTRRGGIEDLLQQGLK